MDTRTYWTEGDRPDRMSERRLRLSSGLVGLSVLVSGCSSVLPSDSADDPPAEPVRGGATPVDLDRSLEHTSPESDAEFESACLWAAYDRLRSVVDSRLDANAVAVGVTSSIDAERRVLVVERVTVTVDGAGDDRSGPAVDFETVRTATPDSVRATVRRDGTERSCRVPVYVADATTRED